MSYKVLLSGRQLETVEAALHFYERELLHTSPYNQMTKAEEALERKVVANALTRIERAKGTE